MDLSPNNTPRAGENIQPAGERMWNVVGAAVRGAAHERFDLPCQDAQGYRVLPNGVLLAVVADGAGTARFSDQGAQVAVEETLRALEAGLGENFPLGAEEWICLVHDSFRAARDSVLEMAEKSGEVARDFACTLAGLVVTQGGLVAGQIGDGALVCQDNNGDLFPATQIQRGEYANETHFLVQEDALETAVIEYTDRPVCALALMSDGLIRLALKLPAQEPHAPFFLPLFHFIEAEEDETRAADQLARFLSSARVNERTDDDRALILAVKRGAFVDDAPIRDSA